MKIRRSGIGQKFESGIERFRGPDDRYRENNPAPFGPGEPSEEAGSKHHNGSGDMDPGVVLAPHHPQNTDERMTETSDTSSELKWTIHFAIVISYKRRCREVDSFEEAETQSK